MRKIKPTPYISPDPNSRRGEKIRFYVGISLFWIGFVFLYTIPLDTENTEFYIKLIFSCSLMVGGRYYATGSLIN